VPGQAAGAKKWAFLLIGPARPGRDADDVNSADHTEESAPLVGAVQSTQEAAGHPPGSVASSRPG
jgi:hypothetical protein